MVNIRFLFSCILPIVTFFGTACQQGPYVPLQKSPSRPPLQHTQRILILDRNVRNALLFVNSVQNRLPGGQIVIRANFQNRFPNDDLWAEIKIEFQDENSMLVDETEWVNTLFARGEVTMVKGNSISDRAVKHVLLLRNLRSSTGRRLRGANAIFEVPGSPPPDP